MGVEPRYNKMSLGHVLDDTKLTVWVNTSHKAEDA